MEKKNFSPRQRLIFALDVPNLEAAASLITILSDQVGFFKIGLELFISEGPAGVRALMSDIRGRAGLFLDLKLHDIPATVGRAMASVSNLGADLVTVHAEGGLAMVRDAKASAGSTKVLAVTVLTSLNPQEHDEFASEYRDPLKLVVLRAQKAYEAGCDGFVCSGFEAGAIREKLGSGPLIVTPGIRPAWSLIDGDDQKRIVTPGDAIGAGADLLVVGRPIRDSADPARAAAAVVEEIAKAC